LNVTAWYPEEFRSGGLEGEIDLYGPRIDDFGPQNNSEMIFQIGTLEDIDIKNYIQDIINASRNGQNFDIIEVSSSEQNFTQTLKVIFERSPFTYILYIDLKTDRANYYKLFQTTNYKKYSPLIEAVVNSTELIDYNKSSMITYENPLYGIKTKYPIDLVFESLTMPKTPFEINRETSEDWNYVFEFVPPPPFPLNFNESKLEYIILVNPTSNNYTLTDLKNSLLEFISGPFAFVNSSIGNLENFVFNKSDSQVLYKVQEQRPTVDYYVYSKLESDRNRTLAYVFLASNDTSFTNDFPKFLQIMNSTELIDYNKSSMITYENPLYGIKTKYPFGWVENNDYSNYAFNSVFYINDVLGLSPFLTIESPEKTTIKLPNNEVDSESVYQRYYYMIIDIPSFYDKGTDYAIEIDWNKTSKNWDRVLYETSALGPKIIEIEYNVSDFHSKYKSKINENKNYITYSLNLNKINDPEKYNILLGSGVYYYFGDKWCNVRDSSQIVPAPPPTYSIIPIINQQLVMNPYDNEEVELQIKSDSQIGSNVNLSSKIINGINMTFSPDFISLSSNEKGFSKIKIETENASLGTYTLPFNANITFPQNVSINLLNETVKSSNPISESIPISSNLTITVESPPEWYQGPLDALNNLSNPLTAIATAVTIISTILGLNILKRRKTKRVKRSKTLISEDKKNEKNC
jgi:hypothetical protein